MGGSTNEVFFTHGGEEYFMSDSVATRVATGGLTVRVARPSNENRCEECGMDTHLYVLPTGSYRSPCACAG